MSWLTARNRSAAKLRSANCVLKNIATIAAMLKPASTQNCCDSLKPIAGRYPNTSGYHAPQMKNSRNIMTDRRVRISDMEASESLRERRAFEQAGFWSDMPRVGSCTLVRRGPARLELPRPLHAADSQRKPRVPLFAA